MRNVWANIWDENIVSSSSQKFKGDGEKTIWKNQHFISCWCCSAWKKKKKNQKIWFILKMFHPCNIKVMSTAGFILTTQAFFSPFSCMRPLVFTVMTAYLIDQYQISQEWCRVDKQKNEPGSLKSRIVANFCRFWLFNMS